MTMLLAIAILFQQEEAPPQAPPPVVMDSVPVPWTEQIHGRLRLLNRSRWMDGDSDADLFSSLAIWAGNPEKDMFSASATGRLNQDWDGNRHHDGSYTLDSLSDSYTKATTGQL